MCNKLWSREVPGERFNQERILAEVIATARKVTGMMFSVLDVMMMMFSVSCLLASYPHNHGNDDLLFPLWLTVVYSTVNPYAFFCL